KKSLPVKIGRARTGDRRPGIDHRGRETRNPVSGKSGKLRGVSHRAASTGISEHGIDREPSGIHSPRRHRSVLSSSPPDHEGPAHGEVIVLVESQPGRAL